MLFAAMPDKALQKQKGRYFCMGKFVINGGKKLNGTVKIESAKNSVLPILAGSVLTDEKVVIRNCPKIKDVLVMIKIIESAGAKTCFLGNDLIVDAKDVNNYDMPSGFSGELRSSVFMLGSLLARLKKANVKYPGGCNIGNRPIDIHIAALKKLGAKIESHSDGITCSAEKIKGNEISFPFPTVGGTENVLLCTALSEGKTVINNAAKEPEIVDLANFLNSMGAKIVGAGTSKIEIIGVNRLHGTIYTPIPDRIEAGTFLIFAAITGGKIQIEKCPEENILSLTDKIRNNTCKIEIKNDIIKFENNGRIKSTDVKTLPFPEFPTDLQAPLTALLSVADGTSHVTETVFNNRFRYVNELVKMGADITVDGNTAVINGVNELCGRNVTAEDLRGGAALIAAGLCAKGQTVVDCSQFIERGYYRIEEKLRALGAEIYKYD